MKSCKNITAHALRKPATLTFASDVYSGFFFFFCFFVFFFIFSIYILHILKHYSYSKEELLPIFAETTKFVVGSLSKVIMKFLYSTRAHWFKQRAL